MDVVDLKDYAVSSDVNHVNLTVSYFSLSPNDVCCVYTDSFDLAHLFLKALATLVLPLKGIYRFNNRRLDFSDYRNLLSVKKNIGYIAPGTSLLSNRTIEENLMLTRYYYENSLEISLDGKTSALCDQFDISDKLHLRPADLDIMDYRAVITVRELTKTLDLLLLERPEDFVGYNRFHYFAENLETIIQSGVPVVFFSSDDAFIHRFSTKTMNIRDRRIADRDK